MISFLSILDLLTGGTPEPPSPRGKSGGDSTSEYIKMSKQGGHKGELDICNDNATYMNCAPCTLFISTSNFNEFE